MLAAIAFYVLAVISVVAAFAVISARNPVHSVLFLILTFFSAAGLFVLLGAEFLAMLLVVVYVGAVAVLFLFVVMMLDVDFVELKQGFLNYLPVGALVALALLGELGMVASATSARPGLAAAPTSAAGAAQITNAEAIGRVLYTDYLVLFQLAGFVLFVAMIGAIVLTLRHRPGVRKQNVAAQVGRRRAEGVELKDVRPGQGVGRAMFEIGLPHYLGVAAALFTIGVFGIFVNRKNIIIILMSIELVLLSVNINLVAFSSFVANLEGQIFALIVLTVAAAEAAVGLAILVTYFRNRGSIAVEDLNLMKG